MGKRATSKVCGAGGSPWKMYISPVHAIMTLHNVKTNEVIWDYKAKEKDLLRVVEDIIVAQEGISSKTRMAKEREEAWEQLQRDR